MVRVRLGVTAVCVAMLAVACSSPTKPEGLAANALTSSATVAAHGQGKPSTLVATITFADQAGDAITSDGSSYPNGQLLSGGQMGLLLRGTTRRLNFNLNGIISGGGPTGTLTDDTNVSVNDVASIPIGSTQPRRAIFNTAVGQFNFDTAADSATNSAMVTHVDATTWSVETGAGDIAVLVRTGPDPNNPHKTITVVAGYYHLPFKFTGVTQ